MGRVQDRIAEALAAEVEGRAEWDEPPALFFIYLEGGQPRLSNLDFPDEWWAGKRPATVLDAVSRCWGEYAGLLSRVAPEGLHGAAFRSEMWMARATSDAVRAARERRLSRHPGRVEHRTMWAVDRAGTAYMAVLARGVPEARTRVSYPGPVRVIEGDVPMALERIVASVLGVSLP